MRLLGNLVRQVPAFGFEGEKPGNKRPRKEMFHPDTAAIRKAGYDQSFPLKETTQTGLGHLFGAERKQRVFVVFVVGIGALVKLRPHRSRAQTTDVHSVRSKFFVKRV